MKKREHLEMIMTGLSVNKKITVLINCMTLRGVVVNKNS